VVLWARLTRDATVDDAEADRAVVSFAEPISSGYVLIKRDHLANVTSLAGCGRTCGEHENLAS